MLFEAYSLDFSSELIDIDNKIMSHSSKCQM